MFHIIGCGGVGVWVALGLSRMRRYMNGEALTLWDGDRVEDRNLERQLFHDRDVQSCTKATCLRRQLPNPNAWVFTQKFFDEYQKFTAGDTVFVAVDNFQARDYVLQTADRDSVKLVIGMANEVTDSEAWIYYPGFDRGDSKRDPRMFAPLDGVGAAPDPTTSCSSAQQIEAAPQTALANMGAAWTGLHLWYLHTVWITPKVPVDVLIHRVGSGATNVGRANFGD